MRKINIIFNMKLIKNINIYQISKNSRLKIFKFIILFSERC